MKVALNFERYELKFHIAEELVKPISDFAEIYCCLDPNSAKTESHYYVINSLYFDSPKYRLLERKQNGVYDRFVLRVRSYGEYPEYPYFLEVKRKQGEIIRKSRARVFNKDWVTALEMGGEKSFNLAGGNERANQDLFYHIVQNHGAIPNVLTQYRRKAYVSTIDDYARITFDRDLRFQFEAGYNLIPDEKKMINYDNTTLFLEENAPCILEIKCTTRVPSWIIDMIRTFDLTRSSFSKYENGVKDTLDSRYIPNFERSVNPRCEFC